MKKFKTVDECFKALGLDVTINVPDVSALPEKDRRAVVVHYFLLKIIEAHCDGWQPDWSDRNQWKYFPWFYVEAAGGQKAGSGLSCDVYDGTRAATFVGSRLCVPSAELAEHVGKTFIDLYTEYLLFQN